MRSAMQLAGPESSSPIFWLAPRKVDVLVAPPGPALPEQLCRFDPPPPGVALTLDSYFDELRRDRGEGSFHELMESVDKTFAERKSSDAYSEQVLKGPGPLTSLEIADASTYVRALCDESADGAFHATLVFMQEAHMALAVAAAAREFEEGVETAEPLANLGRDLLGFSEEADRQPPRRLAGVDPAAWSLDWYLAVVAGKELHWKYAPSSGFAAGAAAANEFFLLFSRCRMSPWAAIDARGVCLHVPSRLPCPMDDNAGFLDDFTGRDVGLGLNLDAVAKRSSSICVFTGRGDSRFPIDRAVAATLRERVRLSVEQEAALAKLEKDSPLERELATEFPPRIIAVAMADGRYDLESKVRLERLKEEMDKGNKHEAETVVDPDEVPQVRGGGESSPG